MTFSTGTRAGAAGDLSTSFTASSLSDPFPLISSKQFRTISRVVTSLPPAASTWASFSETYSRLEIEDEDSYGLFLKLSLEPGRDWREKWEAAKASLEERGVYAGVEEVQAGSGGAKGSAATFKILKAKVDKVTTPRDRPTNRPSPSTERPPTRPKSAAAFPSSTGSAIVRPTSTVTAGRPRDFLVKSGHGRSSSSDDFVGVPRSDLTGPLAPPIATKRSPVVPPATTSARTILQNTKHVSLPPPPPRLNSPAFTSPPQRPLPAPEPSEIPFQSISLATKFETAATNFRRLSLLGTIYFTWRSRFQFLSEQSLRASQARNAIDLSNYLREWRNKLGELRDQQRELRDKEKIWKRVRLRRQWVKWRTRREEEVEKRRERRRQEREDSLRRAYSVVNARWEDKARRECFTHWQQRATNSRAVNFRRTNLLLAALKRWRSKQSRLRDLRILADRFTKQQVLVVWLRRGELQYLEGNFVRMKEEKILGRFWDWWRDHTRESQHVRRLEGIADRFRIKSRFTVWRRRFGKTQSLDASCSLLIRQKNLHKLRFHLDYWIIEHASLALARAHLVRSTPPLLAACFDKWIGRYETNKVELDGRATALLNRSGRALVDSCMTQWVDAVNQRRTAMIAADEFGDERLRGRGRIVLESWRNSTRKREVDAAKADVARTFFLQRRTWQAWSNQLARRRIKAAEVVVLLKKKKVILDFWLAETRKAKAEEVVVESFQTGVDKRILQDTLRKWTERVVDLRARELQTQELYDIRLKGQAFVKWTDVCLKHGEQYSLVENFRLVNQEVLQRRTFQLWLRATRTAVELRRRLESHLSSERRHILRVVYDRLRERALQSRELATVEKRIRGLLSKSFLAWKDQTKVLPAIQRDRINTRRRVFETWRDQVPNPKLVRQAAERDKMIVTRHCFKVLQIKYEARAAVRSATRFRSFAPVTHSSHFSTPPRAPSSPRLPSSIPRPRTTETEEAPTPSPPLRPTYTSPFAFRPRRSSEFIPLSSSRGSQDRSDDRAVEGVRARLRAAAAATRERER